MIRNQLNIISGKVRRTFNVNDRCFFSATVTTILLIGGIHIATHAQTISLTTGLYSQDFDTLSNTASSTANNLTINGWYLTESGGGVRDNEQYGVDTGGSNTGDMYSYGAAGETDRALGGLRSGLLVPIFGAAFTNNTGSTITLLDLKYAGEEWRLGAPSRTDRINFEYSTNASDLVSGTWTGVAALNFVTPDTVAAGAKNGNAAADRAMLHATVTGLNILNGATFWIRWTDTDTAGIDDGLAVDDFLMAADPVTAARTSISGRVFTSEGRGLGNIRVTLTDRAGGVRAALTTPFGHYRFDDVPTGEAYTLSVSAKGLTFNPPIRIIRLDDLVDDANFIPDY